MWAYKAWQGLHFPAALSRRDQLPTYTTWCNAVEGNTTYYGLPAARTVGAWARESPREFRFVFKLPRAITHERRLRDASGEVTALLDRLAPLGERAEQLSIQLPPSFAPSDLDALETFVGSLPSTHRFAVELRHLSFYEDAGLETMVEGVLGAAGVEWISLDTTTLYGTPTPSASERGARRQKPHLPRRLRALTSHPVIRFVGGDDLARTRAGWQPWIPVLGRWLDEGRHPTVFIHTPDNLHAPVLARALYDDVQAVSPGLDPLPEPRRAEPPAKPTLF
jgi:uncharacterized protein YecE (DUF72 family)